MNAQTADRIRNAHTSALAAIQSMGDYLTADLAGFAIFGKAYSDETRELLADVRESVAESLESDWSIWSADLSDVTDRETVWERIEEASYMAAGVQSESGLMSDATDDHLAYVQDLQLWRNFDLADVYGTTTPDVAHQGILNVAQGMAGLAVGELWRAVFGAYWDELAPIVEDALSADDDDA